jgi:starch phosphorylase
VGAERQDPTAFLGLLGVERLAAARSRSRRRGRVEAADADLKAYLTEPRWYQDSFDNEDKPDTIAYFSAAFGITAVLPQYSGGLGISPATPQVRLRPGRPDRGRGPPLRCGYFRQSLTRDGWQAETYPVIDPDNLPLALLREDDGTPARVTLSLPGSPLPLGAGLAGPRRPGAAPAPRLERPENDEVGRHVTDRLYGGSAEHRLQQELLLGMGGVKAVRLFQRLSGAAAPQVFHCNEGHAGFLGIERARELIETEGLSFREALESVKAGTVFTRTHRCPRASTASTPTWCGPTSTVTPRYRASTSRTCSRSVRRTSRAGAPGVFNMAVMGLRTSTRANGGAKLHGRVSRGMVQAMGPGFDVTEVPISSVTNGVHGPTWTDPELSELAESRFTPEQLATGEGWLDAETITDEELWKVRRSLRTKLVNAARARVREAWLERGPRPPSWAGPRMSSTRTS